ncbi:MAG: type II secretion system protein [Planctomycetota bacterium]|nr:MAG: type II secretion system protein [Planctomycetota bacterium]
MPARKAFTLVELLVVIAIIALLMSILMPSLSRARNQAKAAICQSRLKQWGVVFTMYTNDHDGYTPGLGAGDWTMTGTGGWWMNPLRPYYKEPDLKLCPSATKPYTEGGTVPFGAWTINEYYYDIWDVDPPVYGSYGPNGWIAHAVEEDQDFKWFVESWEFHWRSFNVNNSDQIPLMLDCITVDGWPHHTNDPPEFEGWYSLAMVDEMKRFCLNRHDAHVNGVFMDCSVRKIGLKELWQLRWNRDYYLNYPLPVWPPWMTKFKDYE